MSDLGSASANALNIQQLFASLTGSSTAAPSTTDPDAFGQNLPTDPAGSAPGGTTGALDTAKGSPRTGTTPTSAALGQQAKAKRDAALAQSRLDLLGLQEQSGRARAHGAGHGHGHHGSRTGAARDATAHAATSSSTVSGPAGAVTSTGITEASNEDKSRSGLSTLLLAQMAAA